MDPRTAVGLMVVAVVIVAMAVTSTSLQQEPTYEASAQVWVDAVSPANGKIQPIPLAPSPQTLQALTLTMIHTIDSRPVAEEAIQRLGLQMKPAELLDNLTIEQVEGTQFIVLTFQGNDPVKAAKIVNTVGQVSSERISPISAVGSKYTATVWEKAAVPDNPTPVSPRPLTNGLLTLVIGGLVLTAVLTLPQSRPLATRIADTLGKRPARQGVGQAGELGRDRSIVERVKEKKLLRALGRRGKLTAVEAALESELSVEEADRMLSELAAKGHLQVIVEHGRLYYAFWEHDREE